MIKVIKLIKKIVDLFEILVYYIDTKGELTIYFNL